MPVVVFFVSSYLAPVEPREEFFSAASQVIPVLLLVLIFEARYFDISITDVPYFYRLSRRPLPASEIEALAAENRADEARRQLDDQSRVRTEAAAEFGRATQLVQFMGILVTGEVIALAALGTSEPSSGAADFVFGAAFSGLFAVALTALLAPTQGS